MTLEDKVKQLIEAKSGSVRAFSIESDVPYTTLRSILERGIMKANVENIFKIAKHLNIKPEQLANLENSTELVGNILSTSLKLNENRKQKVYDFAEHQLEEQNRAVPPTEIVYVISKLSAGTGIIDLDLTTGEEKEFLGSVPPHDLAFEVSGDSMEPFFKDSDIVFVKKTMDIHNSQIIAVQINEEAYIKKAYIEEDKLRLVSLNKEYEDIIANKDDDIRVIGRVIL